MNKVVFAVMAALAAAGIAVAKDTIPKDSIEARLQRLEQAIARLEKRASNRSAGGMMKECRDMMSGGTMGGANPNDQWRAPDGKR